MKRVTDWFLGFYRITISGASPQWCLNRLTQNRIQFWGLAQIDEFSVSFCIYRCDLERVKHTATNTMCEMIRVIEVGFKERYRGLKNRWCLLVMLGLSMVLAIVSMQFVWFFQVIGNETVPSEQIIREVMSTGVTVGTYGKNIRSVVVKNAVLSRLPQLSWLTVNQSGGRAVIEVREKKSQKSIHDRRSPANVVAAKNGLITNISVWEGAASAVPGDVVNKGELLISGYVDLEYKYRVCGASGEVYARTWTNLDMITPEIVDRKNELKKEKSVFYLCFGQKRIKITPGGRNYTGGCDKIAESYDLTLPGGLQLPISLVRERYSFYEKNASAFDQDYAKDMLQSAAADRMEQNMVAGVIQNESMTFRKENGIYRLLTSFECEEMIGRTVAAEIFKGEMQHDGTSD